MGASGAEHTMQNKERTCLGDPSDWISRKNGANNRLWSYPVDLRRTPEQR